MVSKKVIVSNPSGFHVRPAGVLVKAADSCTSKIEILYEYNIINARSLLNILAASIPTNTEIELQCTGPDEEKDLETMLYALDHLEG